MASKKPQPTVTLKQISGELAEKHGLTKKQATEIMDDLVGTFEIGRAHV